MWNDNSLFKAPENPEQTIWKYMTFPKFIHLIEYRSLFFTRADKLRDIAEGTYPKIIHDLKENTDNPILKHNLTVILQSLETYKNSVVLNCWNVNNYEDYCLWKCYSDFKEGIVIKSTYNKLKYCFHNDVDNHQYIGLVDYKDFSADRWELSMNFYQPFIWKMQEYSSEKEMRILSNPLLGLGYENMENKNGININIDLPELIDSVIIGPESSIWFEELINKILYDNDIKKTVEKSQLKLV